MSRSAVVLCLMPHERTVLCIYSNPRRALIRSYDPFLLNIVVSMLPTAQRLLHILRRQSEQALHSGCQEDPMRPPRDQDQSLCPTGCFPYLSLKYWRITVRCQSVFPRVLAGFGTTALMPRFPLIWQVSEECPKSFPTSTAVVCETKTWSMYRN